MANWGAFAGGLAEGIESGQKLALQRQAADRDQQEFDQKKKDWERQNAMHAAIDAAGNTIKDDTDPSQVLTPDAYTQKFAAPKDGGGIGGWLDRQFGGSKAAPTAAAPVQTPTDFTSKYNTPVDPASAKDYEAWKSGLPEGMDKTGKDYDLQGAFMAGLAPGENGHLPDTYKKPNHPTFSNESKYSGGEHGVGGQWAQDADGKWTFAASQDQLKNTSPDAMKKYFSTSEKDSNLVLPAVKASAFAKAAAAASPNKASSKDDYAPVTLPDGSLGYAPKSSITKRQGLDKYNDLANAIAPFDPVQALNMKKSVQELQSGDYKLKSQQIEEGLLAAGRKWSVDPQGSLDDISKLHGLVPDGQQVKLTYDPKSGKVQSQFFTQSSKGLIPQGKPQMVSFDDVMKQALSYATPENYYKNQQQTLEAHHYQAEEMNARAQTETAKAHLALAQKADDRAAEHDKATADYLKARTSDIQSRVGAKWTAKVTKDDDGNVSSMLLPKDGKGTPKVQSAQWGDAYVSPMYDKPGAREAIEAEAAKRGLSVKVVKDPNHPNFGQVVYVNPQTRMFSTNIDEAASGKASPQSSAASPLNGANQVPAPR